MWGRGGLGVRVKSGRVRVGWEWGDTVAGWGDVGARWGGSWGEIGEGQSGVMWGRGGAGPRRSRPVHGRSLPRGSWSARPGRRRAQCAGARLSAAGRSGGLGPTPARVQLRSREGGRWAVEVRAVDRAGGPRLQRRAWGEGRHTPALSGRPPPGGGRVHPKWGRLWDPRTNAQEGPRFGGRPRLPRGLHPRRC